MADGDDFTSVPRRMTVCLLGGAAAAVLLGVLLLTDDGGVAGWALIAASAGPLFVLLHAHRTARANRRRAESA